MNWEALTAGTAVLTFLTVLFGGAFIYGKLTQKTTDTAKKVEDQQLRLDRHDQRITATEITVGELKAFREGYNLGARTQPTGATAA